MKIYFEWRRKSKLLLTKNIIVSHVYFPLAAVTKPSICSTWTKYFRTETHRS